MVNYSTPTSSGPLFRSIGIEKTKEIRAIWWTTMVWAGESWWLSAGMPVHTTGVHTTMPVQEGECATTGLVKLEWMAAWLVLDGLEIAVTVNNGTAG
jgi:hypothetical protein